MIYVTGDTHGDTTRFNRLDDAAWTADDYLIICGDFGYIFDDNWSEKAFLDYLESEKPYTICFCDGNHENFPAINKYDEEEWNGGRIHRIRKNLVHLMRGYVFDIQGKRVFVFGGANSVDKAWRIPGVSWWPEEQPSDEEYARGWANLERCDYKVDYVITHTAPQALVERMIAKQPWDIRAGFRFELKQDERKLMDFLGEVEFKIQYKHWYFGHWHFDTCIDDASTAVLHEVYTPPEEA